MSTNLCLVLLTSVKVKNGPTIKLRVGNYNLYDLPAANKAILEMLRTFSDNPTCRHIIFGGCHDSGYLLNLEQFKHNETKAAHVTLLETTPALRGFAELSHFQRARFESVFKSEPLPETSSTFMPITSSAPPVQSPGIFRAATNPSPRTSVSVTTPAPNTPPSSVTGPPTDVNGDPSWGTFHVSSLSFSCVMKPGHVDVPADGI
jgi:hypothetical protein